MKKLNGKTALITGGSSGIGLATAKRFLDEEAKVIITGRDEQEITKVCQSLGENIIGIRSDVANRDDRKKLFSVIKEKFGHLDILFANAGMGIGGKIGSVSEEDFDTVFAVNAKGLFFTVQEALTLLKDGSSIILTASAGARKGGEALSVYSATKAAVRSFARSWSSDLRSRKIRVNSLSPGMTKTPIFEKLGMNTEQVEQLEVAASPSIPLGRFGTPDESAAAALFLASDDSSYITGIDLCVDGGLAQV